MEQKICLQGSISYFAFLNRECGQVMSFNASPTRVSGFQHITMLKRTITDCLNTMNYIILCLFVCCLFAERQGVCVFSFFGSKIRLNIQSTIRCHEALCDTFNTQVHFFLTWQGDHWERSYLRTHISSFRNICVF